LLWMFWRIACLAGLVARTRKTAGLESLQSQGFSNRRFVVSLDITHGLVKILVFKHQYFVKIVLC
jgi:hypothetical protein